MAGLSRRSSISGLKARPRQADFDVRHGAVCFPSQGVDDGCRDLIQYLFRIVVVGLAGQEDDAGLVRAGIDHGLKGERNAVAPNISPRPQGIDTRAAVGRPM